MDSLFFWLSKIIWLFIEPDNLLVFLVVAGLVLLLKGAYLQAKILMSFTAFIMVVILFCPVGQWLLHPLEMQFPVNPTLPKKIDGIIVLSGSEDSFRSAMWGQVELNDAAERNFAFIKMIKRYPDAKHVFTGGTGRLTKKEYKAADVARKLFAEQGLDISKIIFEDQSRNTYENAKFTYEKIKPGPGENWVLITTSRHMPRSVGVFNKLGWTVIPYPVDHHTERNNFIIGKPRFGANLKVLTFAVKEWVGLLAYYITGKTTGILPG